MRDVPSALVTTKLHFGPCSELARSRRQRWALPHYSTPPFGVPSPTECMRQACLQNLARESNLTTERCAYTGMEVEQACDDHLAPVAAYVEMGGPSDDPSLPDDTIDAVVVPDSARILQAANTDLRNATAQVDGVIGVKLLSRLQTTIDYPQSRLILACRCGQGPAQVCRTYRDVSYNDADSCVPSEILAVPPDFGRSACR